MTSGVAYNGKVQKPVPTVTYNGKTLKKGTDYTLSYYKGSMASEPASPKAEGDYSVLIKGCGNFAGEYIKSFRIYPKDTVDISKASVKINDVAYTDGAAAQPVTTVKYSGKTLQYDVDYTVECPSDDEWIEVGTHRAVIKGKNSAIGQKWVTFKITGYPMSKVKVTGITSKTYTGSEQTQNSMTLTYAVSKKETVTVKVASLEYLHSLSAIEIINGKYDGYYTYSKNTDVGTATIEFTGMNKYYGTLKKTFKINPCDIKPIDNGDIKVTMASGYEFTRGGTKALPVVKYKSKVLTLGKDYTLSYANNTKYNGSKTPTVKITGKGNFKGSISRTFNIVETEFDGYSITSGKVQVSAPDKAYNGKKGGYKTTITITHNGVKLKAGTDYESKIQYRNNSTGEILGSKDIVGADTVIQYGIVFKEGSGYKGSFGGIYRITSLNLNSLKVKVKDKEFVPGMDSVTLDYSDISFEGHRNNDVEFEIVPGTYKNNTKKGKASVQIRGVNDYGGTRTITFNIKAFKATTWFCGFGM